MLLQVVIGARLEALEDFNIGSLNLFITLWMSNKCIVDLDANILTVSLECIAGELGPIVGNYPIRDPKPADDGLDELDCGLLIDFDHRGCFRAFGELVDDDVQILESSDGPWEHTQDVQPPYAK
jgi:hypothetical protein